MRLWFQPFRTGTNSIAVHCHNKHHPWELDVGVVDVMPRQDMNAMNGVTCTVRILESPAVTRGHTCAADRTGNALIVEIIQACINPEIDPPSWMSSHRYSRQNIER